MRAHWDGEDLTGSVPLSRNLLPAQASIHCQINVHVLRLLFQREKKKKKQTTFQTEIKY
jgi:hypothetical protein